MLTRQCCPLSAGVLCARVVPPRTLTNKGPSIKTSTRPHLKAALRRDLMLSRPPMRGSSCRYLSSATCGTAAAAAPQHMQHHVSSSSTAAQHSILLLVRVALAAPVPGGWRALQLPTKPATPHSIFHRVCRRLSLTTGHLDSSSSSYALPLLSLCLMAAPATRTKSRYALARPLDRPAWNSCSADCWPLAVDLLLGSTPVFAYGRRQGVGRG